MIGLLVLGAIGLWLTISVWIAWRLAKLVKRSELRWLCFFIAAPLLIAAPLADEIIGKYQFERYCQSATEVRIYKTVPVGEEFYTPDGKWRLGASLEERNALRARYENIVQWYFLPPVRVPAVLPIYQQQTKILEKKTKDVLAEFVSYSTPGGWLYGETPLLIRPQCLPPIVQESRLDQQILPFGKKARSQDER